jgi:SAM-dependent methyltransferase
METSLIFDRELIRKNKIRARKNFSNHNFLHHLVSQILLDRIEIYDKNFLKILEIGAMDNFLENQLTKKFNQLNGFIYKNIEDCENFIVEEKFDLIISNLNLHFINQIPEFLTSIHRSLSENGIFLASFFGEENLFELQDVVTKSEEEIYQQISPRMIPTVDIKTAANLLKKVGFRDPASELEKIEIEYSEILNLLRDIRNTAQSNPMIKRSRKFMSKNFLNKIIENYQKFYPKKIATCQILVVSAIK